MPKPLHPAQSAGCMPGNKSGGFARVVLLSD